MFFCFDFIYLFIFVLLVVVLFVCLFIWSGNRKNIKLGGQGDEEKYKKNWERRKTIIKII